MTTSNQTPLASLRLHKTVKARVDRVYRAWTEPEQMRKWFGSPQQTDLIVTQDFREGGEYHIQMICEDVVMNVTGRFETIETNKKIVYTWTSDFPEHSTTDSLVSVQFIDKGESTEIILDQTRFVSTHCAEGHTQGWGFALEKLAQLFADAN